MQKKFIAELSSTCSRKSVDLNTFRSLIALQYRKINKVGMWSYVTLKLLSSKYHLEFPGKYLMNIFLLSFIRVNKKSSLFDTLTKLKL